MAPWACRGPGGRSITSLRRSRRDVQHGGRGVDLGRLAGGISPLGGHGAALSELRLLKQVTADMLTAGPI